LSIKKGTKLIRLGGSIKGKGGIPDTCVFEEGTPYGSIFSFGDLAYEESETQNSQKTAITSEDWRNRKSVRGKAFQQGGFKANRTCYMAQRGKTKVSDMGVVLSVAPFWHSLYNLLRKIRMLIKGNGSDSRTRRLSNPKGKKRRCRMATITGLGRHNGEGKRVAVLGREEQLGGPAKAAKKRRPWGPSPTRQKTGGRRKSLIIPPKREGDADQRGQGSKGKVQLYHGPEEAFVTHPEEKKQGMQSAL